LQRAPQEVAPSGRGTVNTTNKGPRQCSRLSTHQTLAYGHRPDVVGHHPTIIGATFHRWASTPSPNLAGRPRFYHRRATDSADGNLGVAPAAPNVGPHRVTGPGWVRLRRHQRGLTAHSRRAALTSADRPFCVALGKRGVPAVSPLSKPPGSPAYNINDTSSSNKGVAHQPAPPLPCRRNGASRAMR